MIISFSRSGAQSHAEMKLNLEDGYVRVASPFNEVIQLRRQFFNPQHLIVSNAYGVALFHLHNVAGAPTQWMCTRKGQEVIRFEFPGAGHRQCLVWKPDDTEAILLHLESDAPGALKNMHLEMIGAALAACHLNGHFSVAEKVMEMAG